MTREEDIEYDGSYHPEDVHVVSEEYEKQKKREEKRWSNEIKKKEQVENEVKMGEGDIRSEGHDDMVNLRRDIRYMNVCFISRLWKMI